MEALPVTNSSLNQQQKLRFDMVDPSIIRTQFSLARPTQRDASFSSYLQENDPILPTTKQRSDDSEISIFDAEKYFNGLHDQKDNEDGIAKLSDVSSVARISSASSIGDSCYGRSCRAQSFHETPAASSDASCDSQSGLLSQPCGSAAVSIKNLPGSSIDKNTKSSLKWFPLRSRCPCLGKKSVQIEETRSNSGGSSLCSNRQRITSPRSSKACAAAKGIVSSPSDQNNGNDFVIRSKSYQSMLINPKSNRSGASSNRNHQVVASGRSFADSSGTSSNGFTFPIQNNSSFSVKRMFNIISPITSGAVDDPPRDSLEVFQPKESPRSAGERERRSFTFPVSPRSRRASYDEEVGSDASSDLFEIESFSTQATSYYTARRDSLDETLSFSAKRFGIAMATVVGGGVVNCRRSIDRPMTPSVAATEYYPPNVDWNVTTTDGFDRASLTNFSTTTSDVELMRREAEKNEKLCGACGEGEGEGEGGGGGGGGQDIGGSTRGNGLLGRRFE